MRMVGQGGWRSRAENDPAGVIFSRLSSPFPWQLVQGSALPVLHNPRGTHAPAYMTSESWRHPGPNLIAPPSPLPRSPATPCDPHRCMRVATQRMSVCWCVRPPHPSAVALHCSLPQLGLSAGRHPWAEVLGHVGARSKLRPPRSPLIPCEVLLTSTPGRIS